MEISQIKNAICFSNSIRIQNREYFRELLNMLIDFSSIYNEETAKLPYHINLIDELHADENAHSRIFAQLLRYKSNGKYLYLDKFLKDLCAFNINIENPKVEKVDSCGRIDIPIFDKSYVVIIENKVTDTAIDQNISEGGQLARYIEAMNVNYGRTLEEIHLVYTPRYTREPSDASWINKNGYSYKEQFKNRFCSLSYRDKIYPWFKNEVLPEIDKDNKYLHSAIEQYVDHLEGLFNLRIQNNQMNMRLQEFIKKELEIKDENPEEAIEILTGKEVELNNAMIQIKQLKDKYNQQIIEGHFAEWRKLLEIDFPNLDIVGDNFKIDDNIINVGVKLCIDNKDYVAIIECNDCNKANIYYGIGRQFVSNEKHEVTNLLQNVINENELTRPEDWWYGWEYASIENAYAKLNKLIQQV